ncbi:FAD binding domain-containing protein [Thalassobaculum salexigens]|uniref:FAD binding domain-containing protein n=1 Tax=Thalassobaculum salexigens TaxID=455360 RepID=UPI0003F65D9D|nr:FAD binding domain-containing protein [Thalassobaculum salexigens]
MSRYLRPRDLDEALRTLADGGWTVLAGGTDHYPARVTHDTGEDILDVTALDALQGIGRTGAGLRIGAAATWRSVIDAELPAACDGLKAAAREIGGAQIQNRGTIGGNLCNASPAADGVPALLSLDAEVELVSAGGTRRLPLDRFVLGNRKTALEPGELLAAVHLPEAALDGAGRFLKLGARRYLVISIVMVAGTMRLAADGTIAGTRLAVGACTAAALRLGALETALVGLSPKEAADRLDDGHLAALAPIADVRGDAPYRMDTARTLVRRCLADLAEAA